MHHIYIPIPLNMINVVTNRAMTTIWSYAKYENNQYADSKKAEGYTRLITDQNLFVIQKSGKSIQDLNSLTRALPTSA
jgi:hypothetical protein